MSTDSPGLTTTTAAYSDSSNIAIIAVLMFLSSSAFLGNLFAVISILKHSTASLLTLLVSFLSTVELLQAIACATTTLYSYLKAEHSFERNSLLCTFYACIYMAFRLMATLLVSLLTLDRVLLSLWPTFYVRKWISFRMRWILPSSVFVVALSLASLPLATSSYDTSPDGRRFHCLFQYTESYAIFYIVFHFVQILCTFVAVPWVVSREKRVEARLSVLLVGEMVVCRKGQDVVKVRDSLKMSRLVGAIVVFYHVCSVPLPLLLLLRFMDVEYPSVVGLLAIQLPTFGALFYPIIYGFAWKPYRRAYHTSVAFLCPSTSRGRDVKTRRVRSLQNPGFQETRDFDSNSILHTRGMSLHQSTSQPAGTPPSDSAYSEPVPLDPQRLAVDVTPTPDDVSREPREAHPSRPTSFHDRHYYIPSKFQNIFEIIDALSAPRRHDSEDSSEDLNGLNASRNTRDSLDSSGSIDSVKLGDVAVDVSDVNPNSLDDVNFSAIRVSSTPFNGKIVDKVKLDSERKNSLKEFHLQETYRKQEEETSSGQIRFTDLRKARSRAAGEEQERGPEVGNQERFLKYLASESYVNSNES